MPMLSKPMPNSEALVSGLYEAFKAYGLGAYLRPTSVVSKPSSSYSPLVKSSVLWLSIWLMWISLVVDASSSWYVVCVLETDTFGPIPGVCRSIPLV